MHGTDACVELIKDSATGTRARVAQVRAEYPNQLEYSGCCNKTVRGPIHASIVPSSTSSYFPRPDRPTSVQSKGKHASSAYGLCFLRAASGRRPSLIRAAAEARCSDLRSGKQNKTYKTKKSHQHNTIMAKTNKSQERGVVERLDPERFRSFEERREQRMAGGLPRRRGGRYEH